MRKQTVKVVALAFMLATVSVWPVSAQDSPQVRAVWSPPTTGSPVVEYWLEILEDGVPFMLVETPDTAHVFQPGTFQPDIEYIARVQGVDARDRHGPWSSPSEPYVFDAGPPGSCGVVRWEAGKNAAR